MKAPNRLPPALCGLWAGANLFGLWLAVPALLGGGDRSLAVVFVIQAGLAAWCITLSVRANAAAQDDH